MNKETLSEEVKVELREALGSNYLISGEITNAQALLNGLPLIGKGQDPRSGGEVIYPGDLIRRNAGGYDYAYPNWVINSRVIGIVYLTELRKISPLELLALAANEV